MVYNWIISICGSDYGAAKIIRLAGTFEQARDFLFDVIMAEDEEPWVSGPKKKEDLQMNDAGMVLAYTEYEHYECWYKLEKEPQQYILG